MFHLQYMFNDTGPQNIGDNVAHLAFELYFANENDR